MGYQSVSTIKRTMTAHIHVIGVLCVIHCSFSLNLNCTKLTTSCPTAAQWLERGKLFNCPGNKRYVCLMAPGNELREGCIFNSTIQAQKTGCPYTEKCDIRTGQPVLVATKNYLPCPPDLDGCPPHNHSGFSILEIYKYARCQGRNSSNESFVSPVEDAGTQTTITTSKIPGYVIWTITLISIAVGFIAIFFLIAFFVRRKRRLRNSMSLNMDSEMARYFSCDSDSGQTSLLLPRPEYHYEPPPSNLICDTSLHQAASNGDIDTVKILIASKADVNRKDIHQDTPLHKAALNDHSEIVKALIDAKADINVKSWCKETPLHLAAFHCHNDIVKILIEAKADVNAKSMCQDTPLHLAAFYSNTNTVQLLIDAKADVNAKSCLQGTPLHRAASNGNIDTMNILIAAKANVNTKGRVQDTPLHKAASKGYTNTVKILIHAKANISAKDLDQDTPLHRAASNGHSDTVKILIDAEADINAKGRDQDTPLHRTASNGHSDAVKILIDAKADTNAKDRDQDTPLHRAASNGHSDTVKILIDARADINAKGKDQDTPLHRAASNDHSDTVNILIDARADMNAKGRDQDTPLHRAASNGHSDIVKILIDAKADTNAKDRKHATPLHKAARNGHIDTVKILIDAKADVNAKNIDEDTPLDMATSNGHIYVVKILICAKANFNAKNRDTLLLEAVSCGRIEIMKTLIDANADVNARSVDGKTPIFNAASHGRIEIMKTLINANADVNAKNVYQNTPLHKAASHGHANIIKALVDAKADVNAKDNYQETPLHLASSIGHSDIVKMLIKAKADVNAKDCNKNTPLHNAARRDHDGVIRILLTSAADFTVRNNNGDTAEELGNQKSKQVFRDCFEKVPREIKRQGVDAIRQFVKSLNEDAIPGNVVSCMFVGHIGSGKTTVVKSLLGLPRDKSKMTNGIDLHMGKIVSNLYTGALHIQDEQKEKITGMNDFTKINVWDFAGKMMHYTMHQDHLSPRHLYVLVFNASLGLDGMVDDPRVDPSDKGKIFVLDYIEFWVTRITTYVQSDVWPFPKIALVGTHIDKFPDTLEISQIIKEIKIKFQPLVDSGQFIVHEDLFINAFDVNAETTRKLRDIILSCGKSYPGYGQMVPRSWNDLHQKLILRKSDNVISFYQLEQMNSQMEKPLNEKELILCIEYFHNLGYLLYFPDEEMKDHVVLDPSWVSNAMLQFIICSNSTSDSLRVQKWLQMQTTGKIEQAYFDEVLLEKNAEASHGNHLHRVMKKIDLVSEPKVYNAEGFEECQNFFYMPCILNRDISTDALSLTENQDAVHVLFSFSTVIPSAIYNKLVASSLSLWPVFDSHIYNGLIILRSGPLHLIVFRREHTQINMSVVHLEDQREINGCLCRTIVQFVEQRLSWILSTYNISPVETKSVFNITYNSAAAVSLKARKIERGDHEQCEGCQNRHIGDMTQDNYVPDDLFLMRVALRLKNNDIYPLAANVYNHKRFADDLQSDYIELGRSDIAWLILMEWRRQVKNEEQTPNVMRLRRVLHQAKINPHILCKAIRLKDEHQFGLDPVYLQTDVHSELLHAVADRISTEYIHVGLELGLNANTILKLLQNYKGRTVELIRGMLQEWYDNNRETGHVKVVNLVTALLNTKSDMAVLHEFEKQIFHDRNRQKVKTK